MAIEHQDALEQRHASGQLAPALDPDQRRVLVVAQRHLLSAQLPQPAHQLGFGIDTHSYRQRIDEQADHIPGTFKERPASAGNTEDDVRFAAVAVQKQGPGTLQQHVERYRRLACPLSESGGEYRRQTDFVSSTGVPFDVLGFAITRHHERGRRAIT